MSEIIKISGVVHYIGATEQVSEKFRKRELVLDISEKFTNYLSVQLVNDKTDLLDNLKKGDEVTVKINLRGREWVDKRTGAIKYFNTVEAWAVEYANANYVPRQTEASTRVENNLTTKEIEKDPFSDFLNFE